MVGTVDQETPFRGASSARSIPAEGSGNASALSLILSQAGRSAEEIASLATLDDADRLAEQQFSGQAPTLASLFGTGRASELDAGEFRPSAEVAQTMADSIEFLLQRKRAGTLLDHQKMLFHQETLAGLSRLGFFGLAIPQQYGGSGAKLGDLGPLLRALTFIHPDLAVMFEVHNFLGPVTPLLDFGTDAQKDYYLPKMARGEMLGSFALTEPGVGADPSKLSLTARRDGDQYLVSGVKWPITNVIYGGICVLVVKLAGEGVSKGRDSAMIIFEVPKEDNDHFRMVRNQLTAFDYLWNARFRLMDYPIPATALLGPPGKGLAQAFSSLAKGRGGICVNSAAKIFRLLAQLIRDPEEGAAGAAPSRESRLGGGWIGFRSTFGKPIGESPRIQTWLGRATCHALASRVLGDVCFRLAANGVRDETMGMIAKVYATKALLQTAIHCYQIQGGRSVHVDQRRLGIRAHGEPAGETHENWIENYIGENIHEFAIATVYEGPNPVLSDVGAPNAMTRSLRTEFLEPIGLAEAEGRFGWKEKGSFALYAAKNIFSSLNPWPGNYEGVRNLTPEKKRWIRRGFRRNRVIGRRVLWIIARYQKEFIEQNFLLGDEGGLFDQLCFSVASLCYAIALDKPQAEYQRVARALDYEAALQLRRRPASPRLYREWAAIGRSVMNPNSALYQDLIADIEVNRIPLDPRFIDRYI